MNKLQEEILNVLRKKVGVKVDEAEISDKIIDAGLVFLSKILVHIVRLFNSVYAAVTAFVATWQATALVTG